MAGVVPSGNALIGNAYRSSHHHNPGGQSPSSSSQFINSNNFNQQFVNGSNSMTASLLNPPRFVPSLRMKSNEFFYKWISGRERGEQLTEIISFIKANNRIPKSNELQFFKVRNIFLLNFPSCERFLLIFSILIS